MHNAPILQYLKKHGQQLDSEIAAATRIRFPRFASRCFDLSARGEISRCSTTRYSDGKPVEGTLCRVAGYIPPATPGRKPRRKKLERQDPERGLDWQATFACHGICWFKFHLSG